MKTKIMGLLAMLFFCAGLRAQAPDSVQNKGSIPPHLIKTREGDNTTARLGQMLAISDYGDGDSLLNYVPIYYINDSTLVIGTDTFALKSDLADKATKSYVNQIVKWPAATADPGNPVITSSEFGLPQAYIPTVYQNGDTTFVAVKHHSRIRVFSSTDDGDTWDGGTVVLTPVASTFYSSKIEGNLIRWNPDSSKYEVLFSAKGNLGSNYWAMGYGQMNCSLCPVTNIKLVNSLQIPGGTKNDSIFTDLGLTSTGLILSGDIVKDTTRTDSLIMPAVVFDYDGTTFNEVTMVLFTASTMDSMTVNSIVAEVSDFKGIRSGINVNFLQGGSIFQVNEEGKNGFVMTITAGTQKDQLAERYIYAGFGSTPFDIKFSPEPILKTGTSGSWDERRVYQSVWHKNPRSDWNVLDTAGIGKYRLYVSGHDLGEASGNLGVLGIFDYGYIPDFPLPLIDYDKQGTAANGPFYATGNNKISDDNTATPDSYFNVSSNTDLMAYIHSAGSICRIMGGVTEGVNGQVDFLGVVDDEAISSAQIGGFRTKITQAAPSSIQGYVAYLVNTGDNVQEANKVDHNKDLTLIRNHTITGDYSGVDLTLTGDASADGDLTVEGSALFGTVANPDPTNTPYMFDNRLGLVKYAASAWNPVRFFQAAGTEGSPAEPSIGAGLGSYQWWPYSGSASAFKWSGYIRGVLTGTGTSTNVPMKLIFGLGNGTALNTVAELTNDGVLDTDGGYKINAGVTWTSGSGTPEGSVTAPVGSLYSRTDGGTGTSLYVKESGTGNTGWAAK